MGNSEAETRAEVAAAEVAAVLGRLQGSDGMERNGGSMGGNGEGKGEGEGRVAP